MVIMIKTTEIIINAIMIRAITKTLINDSNKNTATTNNNNI